ncbi:rhomboid family intramembrane serine protease [Rhodococcus sp. D2-41]|uniref:rhomboid family intramembrane serine protease n=1 Tax=Speluncibacter jeojiensis TaxID=2710754 RepID=UPI00240EBCAE|nr:rhomboid family intramembrane serine protease [Rhodococcus sp. D2-41]MDG3009891.1 rhomboid family intramembrane serine protease [Rhodococcus sp. D2-41]
MTHPGWGGGQPPGGQPPQPGCYRHPDRPTGLSCARCGRPACPECLREASVGFHCVDCIATDQRSHATARTVSGAPMPTAGTHTPPRPVITYLLIAVNTAIFLATAAQAGSLLNNQHSKLFIDLALYPPAVVLGDYWRLIGSGFLHYGPLHLLVNMYALYIVGRDCELVLGKARYAAVYAVSLIGGSATVMFGPLNAVTAGASGAIFGIFGCVLIILLRLRRSPTAILAIIVINVIISVTLPGISWLGHLGGLAAGTIATAGLLFAPKVLQFVGVHQPTAKTVVATGWAVIAAVGLLAVAMIVWRIVDLRALVGP